MVSLEFFEYVREKYPALADPALARLFDYLAFAPDSWRGSGLSLSYSFLARLAGDIAGAEARNFEALPFLERFRQDVLPGFTWSEHIPGTTTRTVLHTGLDNSDRERIARELRSDDEAERVFFHSGKKDNRSNRAEERKEAGVYYASCLRRCSLNEDQERILWMTAHAAISGDPMLRRFLANRQTIRATLTGLNLPEPKHINQLKILKAIKADARTFYLPSGLSPRLNPALIPSAPQLKREVRKALCAGWTDIDLRSSQLAIFAHLTGAEKTADFLRDPNASVWRELHSFVTGEDAAPSPGQKENLKDAVYAITYGKAEAKLAVYCAEKGIPALLEHELIRELLEKRKPFLAQIRKDGQVTDLWGKVHRIKTVFDPVTKLPDFSKGVWAGSLAATLIQGIELKIASSVFPVFSDHVDVMRPMLWQHDGMTVSFTAKQKQERCQRQLQRAVSEEAARLGEALTGKPLAMHLESEDL